MNCCKRKREFRSEVIVIGLSKSMTGDVIYWKGEYCSRIMFGKENWVLGFGYVKFKILLNN